MACKMQKIADFSKLKNRIETKFTTPKSLLNINRIFPTQFVLCLLFISSEVNRRILVQGFFSTLFDTSIRTHFILNHIFTPSE
ncbi:hypothetical protein BpHYR1_031983 [Brachionus plicatilis]|uniref:Uncharacterized protein n=1 Tax=Brachionus plicatilis TaxID=10195 RepID=A0A3M7QEM8_BRAPC|nr:hypothetical protein BpHYR1_031983 [Brachionus plicatilis]